MSGSDKSKQRESPPKSPKPSDRGPQNIIEFIDSQAPNTKSAIQRHTAQHAAAQRREARLQAVREGVRPRNLQWQRRSSPDAPHSRATAATRGSSHSSSPASSLQSNPFSFDNVSASDLNDPSGVSVSGSLAQPRRSSEHIPTYSPFEESVLLHRCKSALKLKPAIIIE